MYWSVIDSNENNDRNRVEGYICAEIIFLVIYSLQLLLLKLLDNSKSHRVVFFTELTKAIKQ